MLRLLNYSAASPAADLALEEAIHIAVEEDKSPNTIRLWQACVSALIIGTGQEHAREANLENLRAENVPLLRRHSGGGAVVIGPGVINYSAFYRFANLPGSETIRGAMQSALQPVVALLRKWGMRCEFAGLSDLAVIGSDGTLRKIAGNSQARKRRSVVCHGTVLSNPDWSLMERLLQFPSSVPDYRAGRSHRDFLTSLKSSGAPDEFATFAGELAKLLHPDTISESAPTEWELARASVLLAEKYECDEWNLRR
jgi:lipoate-protein ligase A